MKRDMDVIRELLLEVEATKHNELVCYARCEPSEVVDPIYGAPSELSDMLCRACDPREVL